ncbi:MAG: transglutaminase family protein [Actinomycetota bacterium]|nr:transglutaminase family protein [Actinomycetota bacterium]
MTSEPWRLSLEHVTAFSYGSPARSSFNEVRMVPLTTPRQTTLSAHVSTNPVASQYRYWDYWGTQVVAFDVADPHDVLEIRAEAVVDTADRSLRAACTWPELDDSSDVFFEILSPTPSTRPDDRLAAVAESLRQPAPPDTAEAVCEWVHSAIEYRPGVTGVHTSAAEALAAGQGVCQDLAHVAVSLLRWIGIPARYVSGYLHPSPEPEVGRSVDGQSHAWIEVWTGGWWELDPTNLVAVGPRHVAVGRGRDYSDVSPVRGIYAGGDDDHMSTAVIIVRSR